MATANAASTATSALKHIPSTPVPFKITTQPDGHLPDMDGFELQRLGSLERGWHSVCPIRAGRDLVEGEVISACLVRERDGEMVRVDYTATQGVLKADQWPQAFAQYIVEAGKGLSAGGWNDQGALTCEGAVQLRLWCRNPYRAFSTAPFANNLVQALACDDEYVLASGQSLCLQVRDLTTQHLYEQHVFTLGSGQTGKAWSEALCTQLNRDSQLLRAGVLDAKAGTVTPAAKGNAFWVAQCAGLSVTLAEVDWWPAQVVQGAQALTAGQAVQAWAYDAYSHRLLDSFSWTPTAAQCAAGKWLGAWATALNASSLGSWLLASAARPAPAATGVANATQLTLWQRGEGVRLFTSLAAGDNWVAGPRLDSVWGSVNDAVLVTVRHPYSQQLLGHEVFRPTGLTDQSAWEAALAAAVAGKNWPELLAGREGADGSLDRAGQGQGTWRLWQPRFAGLLLELQNLGDSSQWTAGQMGKYLLATDALSGSASTVSLRYGSSVEASTRSYREGSALLYINSSGNELVFRLSDQARAKGYRVADCYRETDKNYISVFAESDIAVKAFSSDTVIWGKGSKKSAFKLELDYPDACRDAQELTLGHVGYLDDHYLWQNVTEVKFTPPAAREAYKPSSPLCEDYGNTMGSEVFDAGGASETGVEPRTGLFHAHYPVATLQGLGGRGPVCELTLHYSALRGNEAGLGDGWAWRFASLETRDRRLTLADGMTITFTDKEWEKLAKGTRLTKKAVYISSNPQRSVFTLDLPSGRQEVLSEPAAPGSDTAEHNDEFRKEIIRLLKAIKAKSTPVFPSTPSHWTQWALAILCPAGYSGAANADYAEALAKWRDKTKELDARIAYYQRPSLQLLPSTIVSPYGETLALSWQRKAGQFLLRQVKSGEVELFNASYTDVKVEMNVWPTSDLEKSRVTLTLQDHLLRTLKRTQGEEPALNLLQQVDCDYEDDPTLDRVLYRLQEFDGSVERVDYEAKAVTFKDGRPALPRVTRHVLIPGGGAENVVTEFSYAGSYAEEGTSFEIVSKIQKVHEFKQYGKNGDMLVGIRSAGECVEFNCQGGSKSNGEVVSCTMSLRAAHEVFRGVSGYSQFKPSQKLEAKLTAPFAWTTTAWAEVEAKAKARAEAWAEVRAEAWAEVRAEDTAEDSTWTWTWTWAEAEAEAWVEAAAKVKFGAEAWSWAAHADRDFLTVAMFVSSVKEIVDLKWDRISSSKESIALLVSVLSAECYLQRLDEREESKLFAVLNGLDVAKRVSVEKMQFAVATYQLLRAVGRTLYVAENPSWGKGEIHAVAEVLRGGEFMDANLAKVLGPLTDDAAVSGRFSVLKQQIEYSADHTVRKMTTPDNNTSYRCYYPATLSDPNTNTNPITPSDLVEKFTGFPDLSCPAVPQDVTPPLMAEYQCDAHGNPLGLTLYGYRLVTRNARQLLEATSIVTLEGVKATLTGDRLDAKDEKGAMKVVWTAQPGDILWRVRSTSSSEPGPKTPNEGNVRVWSITDEQTTVLGDQRLTMTTEQTFEDNPTAAGLKVTTRAKTVAGTQEVSRETRSRFSRRCLSKTTDGVQTEFEHDGLGRVSKQQRYRFKANGDRATSPESVVITSYAIEQGSLRALTTFPNGSQQRDWLDGLQRLVRSDWRRAATDAFIPLSRKDLRGAGDDDGVVDQQWDYLPGGQALCEPLQEVEMPGRLAWSRDLLDAAGTVEQGLGVQTLLRSTSTLETLANGHLTRSETLCSTAGIARACVVREFDANGRLIELTQTVDGTARKHLLTRDGLGRVTRQTRPDGSVVQRTYHEMSTHVTELKVFKDSKAATAGQVVATQTVKDISTLSTRKVGTREYKFQGDNVTLPDNTQLTLAETSNGGDYQAGPLNLSSVSRSGSITTLASGSGAAQGSDLKVGRWQHSLTASLLPGQQQLDETTPRRTSSGCIWQSLRGLTVATLRADGHWQRVFSDHQGRPLRSWHDHEDVLHRHDDHGRLVERQVHAKRSGAQWQVTSEHDVFGQATLRTFSHNGQAVFAQQLEWRGDGQLLAKHSLEAGKLVRSERFAYDALDRLIDYTCDAQDSKYRPCDEQGKPVKAQSFTWDALSNLQTCVTTYSDDKKRTQAFTYDASNPTRLKAVSTDKQAVEVTHNANGYLTEDGKTRKLTYNAGGQLTQVSDAANNVQASYAYDGYQRLAAQYVAKNQATCELRYAGDTLIGEDWFAADGGLSRQRSINPGLAEYEDNNVNWLIDDPQCGVAGYYSNATLQLTPLLPFGEGKVTTAISSGYNGMRRDPVTGSYHAGNGYRCYDPCLYRHAQPDWLSPFGEGGINDYVHCPDPVNLHDPSGAIMVSRWGQSQMLASLQRSLRDTQPFPVGDRWRRIGTAVIITVVGVAASILTGGTASMFVFAALTALSVVSLGLEVASILLEDSNPELSKKLSTAATVVGVLSIGNFASAFKQAATVLRTAATVAARMARNALRFAWKTLLVWGSSGFVRTGRFLRNAYKAAKASRASAKALAAAKQAKVTDVLGELTTPKFAIVENDALQQMLTGEKFRLLTGWKARVHFVNNAVKELPASAKWAAEATDSAVALYVADGGAKRTGLGILPA
ncbi:RHS repeat-associated core domain-containing protein [Pseudomonas putida]|uniref:RHS repeat-associated core domain-containing protein n=1 Tax=Pseudomonas putida TaxID=303 RepID=UPI00236719C7|nr:RHS repeat-associated core domain-containing protein [Pseudomonas putida]MDD2045987.1 hypothetical protein [Pseudomonas putida]